MVFLNYKSSNPDVHNFNTSSMNKEGLSNKTRDNAKQIIKR